MGLDNLTFSVGVFGGTLNKPRRNGCMEGVKNRHGKISIVIPFYKLNSDITHEDVKRWVEIGNSLIFKADLSTNKMQFNAEKHLIPQLQRDNIKVKLKVKDNYSRVDAKRVAEGVVNRIHNYTRGSLQILKTNGGGNLNGGQWNVNFCDFMIKDTGQCLSEYIKEKLKSIKEEEGDNSFVISYKGSGCVSANHKLAVLTFYRYLYSCYYPTLVKDTLKIIDSGIKPWNALMIAHAGVKKKYNAGYGLTWINSCTIPGMNYVLDRLKKGEGINRSFWHPHVVKLKSFTVSKIDDFKSIEEKMLMPDVPEVDAFIICKNATGCKTLTKNKKYKLLGVNTWGEYKIQADDYCKRHFSTYRFKNK